jgi:hypothetical protein
MATPYSPMNALELVPIYIFKACAQVRLSPLTPSAVLSGRLKPGQVRTHWSLFRKKKQYTWAKGRPSYGEGAIPNSVDLPDTIVESMGL